jgi:Fe-S cluster assembly iron-binding protein IscA
LEYSMLQVTDSAARILRETRAARQLPESFGVRVFFPPSDDGQAALALAFAEEPAEGDQVTEQGGTEIYVAPELAEPLAEHKLDVEDTSEGPRLTLVPPHEST